MSKQKFLENYGIEWDLCSKPSLMIMYLKNNIDNKDSRFKLLLSSANKCADDTDRKLRVSNNDDEISSISANAIDIQCRIIREFFPET